MQHGKIALPMSVASHERAISGVRAMSASPLDSDQAAASRQAPPGPDLPFDA